MRSSSKSVIKGALALQKATEREDRSTKKNADAANNSRKANKKLGLVSTSKWLFIVWLPILAWFYILQTSNCAQFFVRFLELKKVKNSGRKMKKTYSHLMNNKSRKNSHISAGSDIGHDLDVASPNGSISRSINPSPTPGSSGHRYERWALFDKCIQMTCAGMMWGIHCIRNLCGGIDNRFLPSNETIIFCLNNKV